MRAQFLVWKVGGNDDEVAVLLQPRQVLPLGMHDQRVAGLELDVAELGALRLAAAVQRQHADAERLAHADVGHALADQLRTRR